MSDTQNHSARVTDRRVEAAATVWWGKAELNDVRLRVVTDMLAAADAVDAPALARASALIESLMGHVVACDQHRETFRDLAGFLVCATCGYSAPCPVERARRYLADQETT